MGLDAFQPITVAHMPTSVTTLTPQTQNDSFCDRIANKSNPNTTLGEAHKTPLVYVSSPEQAETEEQKADQNVLLNLLVQLSVLQKGDNITTSSQTVMRDLLRQIEREQIKIKEQTVAKQVRTLTQQLQSNTPNTQRLQASLQDLLKSVSKKKMTR